MIHPPQALAKAVMRGAGDTSGSPFSYVDLEARIPARHPLRTIRQVVNEALASQDAEFEALYTDFGCPSIPPERLIRANLIQILFSVRSELQLMEHMEYNLLFRWFVGLGIDDPAWVLIHRRCPWHGFEAVEYATQKWGGWFCCRRLLEPIGSIPPTEAEANFQAALDAEPMAA